MQISDAFNAFNALSDKASDSRRKLVLDYLAEEHSRRAAAPSDYRKDAERTLLRQWFQIPLPESPEELIASICSRDPADITQYPARSRCNAWKVLSSFVSKTMLLHRT